MLLKPSRYAVILNPDTHICIQPLIIPSPPLHSCISPEIHQRQCTPAIPVRNQCCSRLTAGSRDFTSYVSAVPARWKISKCHSIGLGTRRRFRYWPVPASPRLNLASFPPLPAPSTPLPAPPSSYRPFPQPINVAALFRLLPTFPRHHRPLPPPPRYPSPPRTLPAPPPPPPINDKPSDSGAMHDHHY